MHVVSCKNRESTRLSRVLLPSLYFVQYLLLAIYPPRRSGGKLPIANFYIPASMACILTIISSIRYSSECGTNSPRSECLEALVYAGFIVYLISLPLQIGRLYVYVLIVVLVSVYLASGTTILALGSTWCANSLLFSIAFLIEPHFASFAKYFP